MVQGSTSGGLVGSELSVGSDGRAVLPSSGLLAKWSPGRPARLAKPSLLDR